MNFTDDDDDDIINLTVESQMPTTLKFGSFSHYPPIATFNGPTINLTDDLLASKVKPRGGEEEEDDSIFAKTHFFSAPLADNQYSSASQTSMVMAAQFFKAGLNHHSRRLFDEAISLYDEAIEVGGASPLFLVARARSCLELREFDRCLVDVKKALDLNPDYSVAWHCQSLCLKKIGSITLALESLNIAIRLLKNPSAEYYCDRCELYLEDITTAELALADAEKAQRIDPRNPHSWNCIAQCYFKTGNFARAEVYADEAIKLDHSSARFYCVRGMIHLALNKIMDACRDARMALQKDPASGWGWHLKGLIHAHCKEFHQALEAFDRALHLDFMEIEFRIGRFNALSSLNRESETEQEATKILELFRDHPKAIAINTR